MFKKSVDTILAAFSKTIADLEAVEKSSRAESAAKSEQAATLITESKAAEAEANRANTIAANLRGIIDA